MFNARMGSQPITFFACLFIACLFLSTMAIAAPSITLSRKTGPPTIGIRVSGSGFAPNAKVDIFFGAKDEVLVVTDGQGEFKDARIHAPRNARPGEHRVEALERDNGKRAHEPFLVQTDWRQLHREDMTRLNPFENVLNPKTARNLGLKWSYATGHFVISAPAVANGLVYVSSADSRVYALNASTGSEAWRYTTGSFVYSSPAVANGLVYFGSYDYNLYALNASTGTKLWSYATGSEIDSSPTVAEGVVYVGSLDHNLYALNASTGAKLWSYTTGGDVDSTPVVANGVVYVGSNDDNVYALNAPAPGQSCGVSPPATMQLGWPWRMG